MKKRIISYRKFVDRMLAEKSLSDWQAFKREHLQQIAFFQHERLMHLIVTMTVALLFLLAFMAMLGLMLSFAAVAALLLVLLVAYIMHYFVLENEVQRMYAQYDEICQHASAGSGQYFRLEEKD